MRLAPAVGASSECSRRPSASSSSSGASRSSATGSDTAFAGSPPRRCSRWRRCRGPRRRGGRALTIEWLRTRGGAAADQALALVFYTGLALGVVLVSLAGKLDVSLYQYLFGSILTVTRTDSVVVTALGAGALVTIALLLRPPSPRVPTRTRVAGVPIGALNAVVAALAALTVALSMRIVGVLLIAALMVLPVAAAARVAGACTRRWRSGSGSASSARSRDSCSPTTPTHCPAARSSSSRRRVRRLRRRGGRARVEVTYAVAHERRGRGDRLRPRHEALSGPAEPAVDDLTLTVPPARSASSSARPAAARRAR